MRKKIIIAAVIILAAFAALYLYSLYLAEKERPYKEAANEWKVGNYTEALKKFKPLAEKGNLRARLHMAEFYALGQGVEADDEAAKKWLSCDGIKSCINGEAEYSLAYNYTHEDDHNYDIEKAKYWMKISSQKGYKKADEWLAQNSDNQGSR